ncbi:MAG: ABC transporter permease [Bryobacterales bacterium]|nr:ABC transporter permease [Bryobacterales bacterium]MBV9400732.1 ABC transporter permease [Bryobacterales bacterium]
MRSISFSMLVGEKGKYFAMIFGLSFSSLLMALSAALFVGMMTRTVSTIRNAGIADIWVMDPKALFVDDVKNIQDTELYRVRSVAGVKWAVPMSYAMLKARLSNGAFQNSLVLGLDDATLAGGPPSMVQGSLADLRQTDAVIVDAEGAQRRFGITAAENGKPRPLRVGDSMELNDHRAIVVGLAKVERSLLSQPVIYTTYSRALGFSPAERNTLSYVLVKTAPGVDLSAVCRRIREQTGLGAYTRAELIRRTLVYYFRNTAIPLSTGLAALLGLIVGTAVSGQAFYSFTQDNLRYFGVLKAMGASNFTLLLMIVMQAAVVGLIGYGIGIGASALCEYLMRNTLVSLETTWQILAGSAAAVLLICAGSAAISVRKVLDLEPAIVFRS